MQDVAQIEVPPALQHMRRFPLDGALLLFDRDTGLNARCEGPETAHLRLCAPRAVQFGITNRCNLACGFCSRDVAAESAWTADSAFTLLSGLAEQGVLEVAFGGGEPFAFRGMVALVRRLHDETPLAVSLTTNGLLVNAAMLAALRGRIGQLRLSLYDDNAWRTSVQRFADAGARFSSNWLVTPQKLHDVEATVLELCALGCRDVLLLSYNGLDPKLHLRPAEASTLAARIAQLAAALRGRCTIKLDVCWGERMSGVPRLFARADCGAGIEHVVITSDKKLMPCSFHQVGIPIETADDVMEAWRAQRAPLSSASTLPGCARSKGYGLEVLA